MTIRLGSGVCAAADQIMLRKANQLSLKNHRRRTLTALDVCNSLSIHWLQTCPGLPRKSPQLCSPCFKLPLFTPNTEDEGTQTPTKYRNSKDEQSKPMCCSTEAKLSVEQKASLTSALVAGKAPSAGTPSSALPAQKGTLSALPPALREHLRPSLSASSLQLRCISYSCSRLSGSEAVRRCSSSDCIHSWYLKRDPEPDRRLNDGAAVRFPQVLRGSARHLSASCSTNAGLASAAP